MNTNCFKSFDWTLNVRAFVLLLRAIFLPNQTPQTKMFLGDFFQRKIVFYRMAMVRDAVVLFFMSQKQTIQQQHTINTRKISFLLYPEFPESHPSAQV